MTPRESEIIELLHKKVKNSGRKKPVIVKPDNTDTTV